MASTFKLNVLFFYRKQHVFNVKCAVCYSLKSFIYELSDVVYAQQSSIYETKW